MQEAHISLWRIAKHTLQFAADDISGGGAKACGGRWNSKGNAVLYASPSIALATLESLVHLGDQTAIRNIFLVKLTVPDTIWQNRQIVHAKDLPPTWAAEPAGMTSTGIGDRWLKAGKSALLLVPSVIVPEEYNVLINPEHQDSKHLRADVLRQFVYDPRL